MCAHSHACRPLTGLTTSASLRLLSFNSTLMYHLLHCNPALSSSEPDLINHFFPYLCIFPTKLPRALAMCPGTHRELTAQVEEAETQAGLVKIPAEKQIP